MTTTRTGLALLAIAGLNAGCEPPTREAPVGVLPAPRYYVAPAVATAIVVDGRLDDPGWTTAAWTEPFVDIEGDRRPAPRFGTRAKMVWDAEHLYIAAQMEEPHVWGALTEHDSIVYHDNDFEVFLDPDGDRLAYYEVEINALGTIFDLYLSRPYLDGGHADHDWGVQGMVTAVHVDGTLNDPADEDRGWSVEIAPPWSSLAEHAHRRTPPRPGDTWRINFSRVQWRHVVEDGQYRKREGLREDNWVWSPQGIVNMHVPERWGYITFVRRP